MRSLRNRIQHLEAQTHATAVCPTCGHGGGGPVKCVVVEDGEEIAGPDRCPACGRVLVYRITFDAPSDSLALSASPA